MNTRTDPFTSDNQHVSAALKVWRASVIQSVSPDQPLSCGELYYHSFPLGDSFTFHAFETKLQTECNPLINFYQGLEVTSWIKEQLTFIHFIQSTSQTDHFYDTVMMSLLFRSSDVHHFLLNRKWHFSTSLLWCSIEKKSQSDIRRWVNELSFSVRY